MSQLNLDNEGWLWHKHLAYIPVFNSEEEKQEIENLINQKSRTRKERSYKMEKISEYIGKSYRERRK